MFKKLAYALSASALLLFSGSSEAVLVFSDDELTAEKAEECFSREGFEDVCLVEVESNVVVNGALRSSDVSTSTGVLVQSPCENDCRWVLSCLHGVQDESYEVMGFLANKVNVEPSQVCVFWGHKVRCVRNY